MKHNCVILKAQHTANNSVFKQPQSNEVDKGNRNKIP